MESIEVLSRFSIPFLFPSGNLSKMPFTNKTTKAAVRDLIKQAVDKKLIDSSWLTKFDAGSLTGGDFEGLKIIINQRSN